MVPMRVPLCGVASTGGNWVILDKVDAQAWTGLRGGVVQAIRGETD